VKHQASIFILLLSTTTISLAMDRKRPFDGSDTPEKRRRCDDGRSLNTFDAEDLFFMKLGRLHMLQEQEGVERAALAETIERNMGQTPCLKCPHCHKLFNRTAHRVTPRPCCHARLCEACTVATLCPNTKLAEPNPCPLCRQHTQHSQAALQLLQISLNRAVCDEQAVPLGLAQRLLLTQSGLQLDDGNPRVARSDLKKILRFIDNALGRIGRNRSPDMPLQLARDTILQQLNADHTATVESDGEEEPEDGETLGSEDSNDKDDEEEEVDEEGEEGSSCYESSFIDDNAEDDGEEEEEVEEGSDRWSFIDDEEA